MTQTPDITPEAVEQHCRDIHDAVTANELYAPHGVAWQSAMRALSARVRELEAAADDDALTVAHLKGYADGRRAAEAKLAEVVEALTPSGDTKAAYIAEVETDCPDGRPHTVSWTATKDIMKMIKERAELSSVSCANLKGEKDE